jgi:oligopeptidase B
MLFRILPIPGYLFLNAGLLFFYSSCTSHHNKAPVASKKPVELTEHGITRVDNYYWLREPSNPEVIKYLEEENSYTSNWFSPLKPMQERLYQEFTSRIKPDDSTAPYHYNGYYYYNRFEPGKEYTIYCRKKAIPGATEEILLNVNELAKKYSYCQVLTYSVSPDNRLLAYGIDTMGRRKFMIRVMDLETKNYLPDELKVTSGNPIWAQDSKTIFYSRIDSTTLRSCYIFKHRLGQDPTKDALVFEEKDPRFEAFIYKTKSDKFLVIFSFSKISNEYQVLEASNPDGDFRLFSPRKDYVEYDIDHWKDKFLIRTNLDAVNFRLMETSVSNTNMSAWKELIPVTDSIFIESFDVYDNYLVLQQRRNGLVKMEVIDARTNTSHIISFEEETYDLSFSVNMEMNTSVLRYYYSSLTTPASIYEYNMDSRERKLLKRDELPGGFNPAIYEAKRISATAPDGIKIPISLVYRKDLYHPNMPLVINGYGAYGSSSDPDFNPVRLSLLDRGFIFAIAHVRGGEEMGRKWYEDGKMLHKKNTFTDFIACTEHLIKTGYTSPEHLFAIGRSAGGLLMGTISNMRPDLYKGIIAGVPFVDIVTTMLDESIPLTTSEFEEWGNPKEKEYFDYMLSYSPYDNVQAKDYPAMFISAGLHDSQVQYWEPAKWVAKLRDMKTDHNPLLLYTNMDAGHGGASGRFEKYRLTSMEYAFMFKLLGIED